MAHTSEKVQITDDNWIRRTRRVRGVVAGSGEVQQWLRQAYPPLILPAGAGLAREYRNWWAYWANACGSRRGPPGAPRFHYTSGIAPLRPRDCIRFSRFPRFGPRAPPGRSAPRTPEHHSVHQYIIWTAA